MSANLRPLPSGQSHLAHVQIPNWTQAVIQGNVGIVADKYGTCSFNSKKREEDNGITVGTIKIKLTQSSVIGSQASNGVIKRGWLILKRVRNVMMKEKK